MSFADYSTNPDLNITIGGLSSAEGCPPANLNNICRQLAADGRELFNILPTTDTLMPRAAGAFSGTQPIYTGRGAYGHWNNPALTSNRRFLQADGTARPSGAAPGDEVLYY